MQIVSFYEDDSTVSHSSLYTLFHKASSKTILLICFIASLLSNFCVVYQGKDCKCHLSVFSLISPRGQVSFVSWFLEG